MLPTDPTAAQVGMPYSCSELNPALVEYAARYLNETPETRKKGLKEMRDLLTKDGDVYFTDEDDFLLCFLRSRKFDVERSAALLRRGLEFITRHSKIMVRTDARKVVHEALRANILGFLPYRDRQGKAVLYCKVDSWDPSTLPADSLIFGSIVALRSAMDNPVNQVAGFEVILDLRNLKTAHVLPMLPWIVFGTQALQSCCPCLVKQFSVIDAPPIYRMGWKLMKPILSNKIRKRISFHRSSNWSTLHERLPRNLLPKELGGTLGAFSNDHWAPDPDKMVNEYNDQLNRNGIRTKAKLEASK